MTMLSVVALGVMINPCRVSFVSFGMVAVSGLPVPLRVRTPVPVAALIQAENVDLFVTETPATETTLKSVDPPELSILKIFPVVHTACSLHVDAESMDEGSDTTENMPAASPVVVQPLVVVGLAL